MGEKKLETATINKFQNIYCKGKKRKVVEAGLRGKWAEVSFFKMGEVTKVSMILGITHGRGGE